MSDTIFVEDTLKYFWKQVGFSVIKRLLVIIVITVLFPHLATKVPVLAAIGVNLAALILLVFAIISITMTRGIDYYTVHRLAKRQGISMDLVFYAREMGWKQFDLGLQDEGFWRELEDYRG